MGEADLAKENKSNACQLLLEHCPKERSEAVEHLDFAIPEFRDMKMRPWPKRALRHKEILKV